jgi:hypothetical protein
MSQEVTHPITAGVAPLDVGRTAAPAAAPESVSFQRLLESMQKLAAENRRASEGADAELLQNALRAADDGFVTAMDLRQKLEAAFRAQRP